jgi:hypothetical protein
VKLERFLHSVFGGGGQHLIRWRTLTICLPQEEDIAEFIWLRIVANMVNFTSIMIFDAPPSWSNGDMLANADLSNVNTLKTRGPHDKDNFTVHLLDASFTTLISLDIGVW